MSDTLLDAAQRLADVLTQENDALKRMDFTAAVALVPAKEAALTDLTRQPRMRTIPAPVAAIGRRLGGLATENQTLLERAIEVQTRIVRIVARACAPAPGASNYAATGYGANRFGVQAGRRPSDRTAALALSTRA